MQRTRVTILFALALIVAATTSAHAKSDGSCSLMMAMDYPYQIKNGDWTYIQAVVLEPDASPAKGAAMEINGKSVGKADKHGTFIYKMKLKDWGNGGSYQLTAEKKMGKKKCGAALNFSAYPRTKSFNVQELFVYTDRAVYKPGQKILLRALAWFLEGEYEAIAGKDVEYLLTRDETGKVVAGGTMKTNDFGTCNASIKLPAHMKEGNYTLKITYEKATESTTLVVKQFRPPVIEISHDIPRFLTPAAQAFAFDVTPTYFLGGKPKGGSMRVTISKDKKELWSTTINLVGDKDTYHVALEGPKLDALKKKLAENDKLDVTVAVEDQYGRMDDLTKRITYKENPYIAVIELDKDQYTKGEKVNAMAKVVDAEGIPVKDTTFMLALSGGLSDTLEAKTNAGGTATFSFTMPAQSVTMQLKKKDVAVVITTSQAYLIPPKAMLSKIVDPVIKEKTKTKIRITFGEQYTVVEEVVHVDITDGSGALAAAFTVPVTKEDGKQVAKGEFEAPTWGTLLFTIYAAGCHDNTCKEKKSSSSVGLLTEGQQIAVEPNKELQIELDGFPGTAKPGQALSFKATIKDAMGKAIDASVGAAVVDKAVLSLKDPLEQTPMDVFYNPQLKTMATSGSKILTWPVVSRNWGSPSHDIALPPFGYKGPGGTQTYYGANKKSVKKSSKKDKGLFGALLGGAKEEGAPAQELSKSMDMAPATTAPAPPPAKPMSMKAKKYEKKSMEKLDLAEELDAMGGEGLAAMDDTGTRKLGGAAKKPVKITIRKEFPETSLWEPDHVAKKGKLTLETTLPESLTTQQLILVASDDKGGVGVLRKDVTVSQELYVRSDLPPVLVAGDQIAVNSLIHNGTDAAQTVVVSLSSEGLAVKGTVEHTLTIVPHTDAVASWKVEATKAGKIEYEVKAKGETFVDAEQKELFVAPKGMPLASSQTGTLGDGKTVSFDVTVPEDAAYHQTFVSATFPTSIPLLQGVERMASYPYGCAEQRTSITYMNAMVYDYLSSHKLLDEKKRKELKGLINAGVPAILAFQNADGGWGWFWEAKTNILLTAYVVEVLTYLQKLDFYVPKAAIDGAIGYLQANMSSSAGWTAKGAYFYKIGEDKSWNTAITAEIFRILASAYEVSGNTTLEGMLAGLSDAMIGTLSKEKNDPLVIANAALGLAQYTKKKGKPDMYAKELGKAATRLIELREKGYWEPDWFHAYGGTIEATVVSLMLLKELDPTKYAAEYRAGVQYLLATSESFGAWHNTHGTAATLKLFAKLDPKAEKDGGATVTVSVNGKQTTSVKIDPKDPFLSAISLSEMDITNALVPGKNTVTVTYDGALEAPVVLDHEVWPAITAPPAKDSVVKVERTYSKDKVTVSEPFTATLKVEATETMPFVVVVEPKPAIASFDEPSFEALKAKGAILDYTIDGDTAYLYLQQVTKGEAVELSYQLVADKPGSVTQKGTHVEPMYQAALTGTASDTTFVVED